MADLIGQEIGNYRLISKLASGRFGNVYLAQHTLLPERKVAAMLIGAILCSAIIIYSQRSLHISVSVGAWVYQSMIAPGSICVWCLLLTIVFFLGARFGPLIGLVVGGVGFFLGGDISSFKYRFLGKKVEKGGAGNEQ